FGTPRFQTKESESMKSIILQTATRFIITLLLVYSVFILLRGHNAPGGGFIGGLIAATAFALYALAYDIQSVKRILRVEPTSLIGLGLVFALLSGLISSYLKLPFFTGIWISFEVFGFDS